MFKNNFVKALATLTGTIIGVGLFSLPYITSKVGIVTMLIYFLILGAVVTIYSLFYGEISLRTKGLHRLPGYARKYLGPWGERLAFFSNSLGLTGGLLAYLIVGSGFLFSLFKPILGGSNFIYLLIFFSVGAILIYFGIKSIAQVELLLLILFFGILVFVFVRGFSLIETKHLFVSNSAYLFLPYGAVLFSLSGIALVPEVKEMLSRQRAALKKLIFLAIVISVITYLFFIYLVLGIAGPEVSVDAITGLGKFLSQGVISLALIFGFLTVFTSFLTIGLTLKKILWYDLKLKKDLAWALACFVPLILFIIGLNNFITVISLTGGVFLAIDAILITLVYLKAKTKGELKPAFSLNLPRFLVYGLILFFVLGIIYEIIYFAT
jgi:tyrosine-specific transport protein